uniref:hypothetical protein n=1 Tax=Mycobacterium marinum TaxID=1781 RepID=UPI0021C477DB
MGATAPTTVTAVAADTGAGAATVAARRDQPETRPAETASAAGASGSGATSATSAGGTAQQPEA